MKAIVQVGYGSTSVYRYAEITTPEPADDEVLVRVRATSIHPDIWHVMRGWPYPLRLMGTGLRKPKHLIPGTDLAGTIVAVGEAVTRFRPGDEVFGQAIAGSNLWRNCGTFAEYAAVPTRLLALKPEELTFEQAAAVPTTALIALQAITGPTEISPDQRVLVNGAAGGVGSYVVQLAKARGANVTAVDSTDKLDFLREIGADQVIDYTREDFTTQPDQYDLVVDIPGNHAFSKIRQVLAPDGKYLLIGHDDYGRTGSRCLGSFGKMLALMVRSPFTTQLPDPDFTPLADTDDPMAEIASLLADGRITAIVDRTFPLNEVPEAMEYLTTGKARGKVVITI